MFNIVVTYLKINITETHFLYFVFELYSEKYIPQNGESLLMLLMKETLTNLIRYLIRC